MKTIVAILIFTFSTYLFAFEKASEKETTKKEIIVCNFTEPFITLKWDPNTSTVIHTNDVIEETTILTSNAQIEHDYDGVYISDEAGRKLLSILVNKVGSDGMSDFNYPMEGLDHQTYNNFDLIGGCFTESFKPWSSFDLLDGLLPKGLKL